MRPEDVRKILSEDFTLRTRMQDIKTQKENNMDRLRSMLGEIGPYVTDGELRSIARRFGHNRPVR